MSTEDYLYCSECRSVTLHNIPKECTICLDLDRPLTKRTLIDFLKSNLSIQAYKHFGYDDEKDIVHVELLLSNEVIASDKFYT